MGHVEQMIQKLGNCRWPALLEGETGTGKEVVARAIHRVMEQGPFVTIDCSALVGPFVESELFGHAKGAFTDAFSNKTGLIESANGGTAFFDEIGELPLDLQAKLLRVLQEKEFRPVGSLETRKSDFRIIAATNRDLAKEVERGTFRWDLFFRLNVVTVRIPPLRERKEDLRLLIEHFLGKFGTGHRIATDALESMLTYAWPGNVRELGNCIQYMVAVSSGPTLGKNDLPATIQNRLAQQPANLERPEPGERAPESLEPRVGQRYLTPTEENAILEILEVVRHLAMIDGNVLGIDRIQLSKTLRELTQRELIQ